MCGGEELERVENSALETLNATHIGDDEIGKNVVVIRAVVCGGVCTRRSDNGAATHAERPASLMAMQRSAVATSFAA